MCACVRVCVCMQPPHHILSPEHALMGPAARWAALSPAVTPHDHTPAVTPTAHAAAAAGSAAGAAAAADIPQTLGQSNIRDVLSVLSNTQIAAGAAGASLAAAVTAPIATADAASTTGRLAGSVSGMSAALAVSPDSHTHSGPIPAHITKTSGSYTLDTSMRRSLGGMLAGGIFSGGSVTPGVAASPTWAETHAAAFAGGVAAAAGPTLSALHGIIDPAVPAAVASTSPQAPHRRSTGLSAVAEASASQEFLAGMVTPTPTHTNTNGSNVTTTNPGQSLLTQQLESTGQRSGTLTQAIPTGSERSPLNIVQHKPPAESRHRLSAPQQTGLDSDIHQQANLQQGGSSGAGSSHEAGNGLGLGSDQGDSTQNVSGQQALTGFGSLMTSDLMDRASRHTRTSHLDLCAEEDAAAFAAGGGAGAAGDSDGETFHMVIEDDDGADGAAAAAPPAGYTRRRRTSGGASITCGGAGAPPPVVSNDGTATTLALSQRPSMHSMLNGGGDEWGGGGQAAADRLASVGPLLQQLLVGVQGSGQTPTQSASELPLSPNLQTVSSHTHTHTHARTHTLPHTAHTAHMHFFAGHHMQPSAMYTESESSKAGK